MPVLTREICGILATRHPSCLATLLWFKYQAPKDKLSGNCSV